MVHIPLNQPIPLHTYTRERNVERNNEARSEDVMLKEVEPNMVHIKSKDGARALRVLPDGRCVFEEEDHEKVEVFEVVEIEDIKYLRSTNRNCILSYHNENYGRFYCLNMDREAPTTIVFQNENHIHPLVWCAAAGVLGAALLPALGLGAAALVPTAMSTFGTVVSGVGTMHASLAAGGVAATLQASSAALITTEAAAIGATIGTALGFITRKKDADDAAGGDAGAGNGDGDGAADAHRGEGNGEEGETENFEGDVPDAEEEPKNSDSQSPGEFR